MSKINMMKACAAATLLACGPAAYAQNSASNAAMAAHQTAMNAATADVTTAANPDATMTNVTTTVPVERKRDFPWGLLGLLGLAGLLGRRKQEPDVVVDARRDTRP